MSDKSREYQETSISEIRELFRQGVMMVLLWLATGGGKTFIFCRMVKDASAKGKKCMIVVRGRKLVDQASQRLFREGVAHGVLMAGHWNNRPKASVQVCSIDTLIARDLMPEADLIIIDEAHLFDRDSQASELIRQYEGKAFIVAVTATPYVKKGLRHLAEAIVHPIRMIELMDTGFLTKFRYFAPQKPDLAAVKVSASTGDYVNDQLEEAMIQGQLTGKILEHWQKISSDRPTIGFCVNINHSMMMTAKFREAGIKAEHCDSNTPEKEREAIIKRSQSGETKVVFNVGILCTGVDMPWISAIISARPTMSKNLFIQQAGRGTRPVYHQGMPISTPQERLDAIAASVKPNCLLLDHAGNIDTHGLPTDELDCDLDGQITDPSHRKLSKTCKACFAIYVGSECHECGWSPPVPETTGDIEESNEELKELVDIEIDPVKRLMKELEKERKAKGRKPAWTYYKLVNKFGLEKCKHVLPDYFIDRFETPQNAFGNSRFRGSK